MRVVWQFLVSYVIVTLVPRPCPYYRATSDKFGITTLSSTICTVMHYVKHEERITRNFNDERDSAFAFYNDALHLMIGGRLDSVSIDSVEIWFEDNYRKGVMIWDGAHYILDSSRQYEPYIADTTDTSVKSYRPMNYIGTRDTLKNNLRQKR